MQNSSYSGSQPLTLSASTESKVYGFFTLAMILTLVGVFVGINSAALLFNTGFYLVLTIAELALIFTARWWVNQSPYNYVLFGAFPFLSGVTLTPYILLLLEQYTNGPSILFDAVLATVFMSLAAVVLSRVAPNLMAFGKALVIGIIGLLILMIVQIFVPALQTQSGEMIISGLGVVLFALFTAFDLQRIQRLGKVGANPLILALSLYLDIYNLFLFILRLMTNMSGRRR